MENQPTVRLTFTCNCNWEDMTAVKDGRFCNDCQKKVVDFSGKTNDEITAFLMSSTTKVCGRFQQSQLFSSLPKPVWKRWLSTAAMFVAVFMGIKEASAQTKTTPDTTNKIRQDKNKNFKIGEVTVKSFVPANISQKQTSLTQQNIIFDPVEPTASFPGGDMALREFLSNQLQNFESVKRGKVIVQFIVGKTGKLSNFKIMRSLTTAADAEVIRALKNSPKWIPVKQNGKSITSNLTMPVVFN